MKKRALSIVAALSQLLMLIFLTECSTNEFDPSDTMTSLLSGEYGKGKLWKLTTTVNGDSITSDGFVWFQSKYQSEDADFRFVNVIPGESSKEFKSVPLAPTDDGLSFTIDYNQKTENVRISGLVTFGEMTVDITLSE